MTTVERFEDLTVWVRAREIAGRVYSVTSRGPLSRDFSLRDQMRRAAVSVASNIAEGFERGGDREFRQFLATAKGSLGELKTQFYIAADAGLLAKEDSGDLIRLAEETLKLIGGLMRYLATSKHKGVKFKPANPETDCEVRPPRPGRATRDPGPSITSTRPTSEPRPTDEAPNPGPGTRDPGLTQSEER